MKEKQLSAVRIDSIFIENYKGIDHLELSFPAPMMPNDPDIFVMGSKNGVGKTSVIECCAMLILASLRKKQPSSQEMQKTDIFNLRHSEIDIPAILIRAGAKSAKINGILSYNEKKSFCKSEIEIKRNGRVYFLNSYEGDFGEPLSSYAIDDLRDKFINSICGFDLNPIVSNKFSLFHSYRKVQEGNPELSMMLNEDDSYSSRNRITHNFRRNRRLSSTSIFKLQIIRSMMGRTKVFKVRGNDNYKENIETLNDIFQEYAKGSINVLEVSDDNTIGVMIKPNGENEEPYSLDGLSSGQKEITSTTFLIWYYTKNNSSVIFIDEPELHLNSEWHATFIESITELAPRNQYIIATHSDYIMDAVDKDKRILLVDDN